MVKEPEPDFISLNIFKSIKEEKYNGVPESIDPVKSDSEYQLIVEANNMTIDIDNEIATVHRFTRDIYSKDFQNLSH
ncbi:hypothetical protein HZH68_013213 [Vespula germanica]|uniref:Uncharacterized protein n=1 Tax=Vespula germanica TaxID=30212 RepID=A0A834JEA2_VESGE|nr:hypothetical protein HZH68_013213 [Vespula germanica]